MASNDKLQEMQQLEQTLQMLLQQKQQMEMEYSETQAALKELENSGDEVYKTIGQLLIKSDKTKMQEELKNKEKFLNTRKKSIENQEKSMTEKLNSLRDEVMKSQNSEKEDKKE